MPSPKNKEFNYIIGRYWNGKDGQICAYTVYTEVHFGTLEEANKTLEYVEGRRPDKGYKIFKIED